MPLLEESVHLCCRTRTLRATACAYVLFTRMWHSQFQCCRSDECVNGVSLPCRLTAYCKCWVHRLPVVPLRCQYPHPCHHHLSGSLSPKHYTVCVRVSPNLSCIYKNYCNTIHRRKHCQSDYRGIMFAQPGVDSVLHHRCPNARVLTFHLQCTAHVALSIKLALSKTPSPVSYGP